MMPIRRISQKSQQALSSPAAFDIDNFIDDTTEEKEKQLGIQPAGAGTLVTFLLDTTKNANVSSLRAFSISSDKVNKNFTTRSNSMVDNIPTSIYYDNRTLLQVRK